MVLGDNKHMKLTKIIISSLSVFLFLLIPFAVFAQGQGYVPLEPLPGVSAGSQPSLSTYLQAIFNIGIGLGIVLAVVMLVIGGIEYVGGASNDAARRDAKDRIWAAIIGLLIALGAWLLLYTINPQLLSGALSIKSVSIPASQYTPPSSSTGTNVAPPQCYSVIWWTNSGHTSTQTCTYLLNSQALASFTTNAQSNPLIYSGPNTAAPNACQPTHCY